MLCTLSSRPPSAFIRPGPGLSSVTSLEVWCERLWVSLGPRQPAAVLQSPRRPRSRVQRGPVVGGTGGLRGLAAATAVRAAGDLLPALRRLNYSLEVMRGAGLHGVWLGLQRCHVHEFLLTADCVCMHASLNTHSGQEVGRNPAPCAFGCHWPGGNPDCVVTGRLAGGDGWGLRGRAEAPLAAHCGIGACRRGLRPARLPASRES